MYRLQHLWRHNEITLINYNPYMIDIGMCVWCSMAQMNNANSLYYSLFIEDKHQIRHQSIQILTRSANTIWGVALCRLIWELHSHSHVYTSPPARTQAHSRIYYNEQRNNTFTRISHCSSHDFPQLCTTIHRLANVKVVRVFVWLMAICLRQTDLRATSVVKLPNIYCACMRKHRISDGDK